MDGAAQRTAFSQVLVGCSMFCLLEAALVWNVYAEWLPEPHRAPNPSPERHLQFAAHSMVAMFFTGGVLTYLFADVDWDDTPAVRQFGYNDISAVLDYPPSIYIMPAFWFVAGSGFLLYSLEDTKRLLRQSTTYFGTIASYLVNVLIAAVALLFSVCLAIRAQQDIVVHTVPMLCLVLVLPLPFVMQACEVFVKRKEMKRPERSYGYLIMGVSWFAAVSFIKGGLTIFAGTVRHVNPSFAKLIDDLWLILVFAVPFLLHPAPQPVEQPTSQGQYGAIEPSRPAGETGKCVPIGLALAGIGVAGAALLTSSSGSPSLAALAAEYHSEIGYHVVQMSHHCANQGETCHCPGGFVIFGRGTEEKNFASGIAFAKWDVYPRRLVDPIACNEANLGDPFIFSGSEECRCVPAGLECKQLSRPSDGGCGIGSSSAVLNLGMTGNQARCCNRHDRCYGLCGKTKHMCDQEFGACLDKLCQNAAGFMASGDQDCGHQKEDLKKAIMADGSEAAYSSIVRQFQHWSSSGTNTVANMSQHTQVTGPGQVPGESVGGAQRTSHTTLGSAFDCSAAKDFWQVEWSDQKKSWCCANKNLGCDPQSTGLAIPVVVPLQSSMGRNLPPTPALATTAGAATSRSKSMRTTSAVIVTTTASPMTITVQRTTMAPPKPFNCLTTDTWSLSKATWCCTNLGLGCQVRT